MEDNFLSPIFFAPTLFLTAEIVCCFLGEAFFTDFDFTATLFTSAALVRDVEILLATFLAGVAFATRALFLTSFFVFIFFQLQRCSKIFVFCDINIISLFKILASCFNSKFHTSQFQQLPIHSRIPFFLA